MTSTAAAAARAVPGRCISKWVADSGGPATAMNSVAMAAVAKVMVAKVMLSLAQCRQPASGSKPLFGEGNGP